MQSSRSKINFYWHYVKRVVVATVEGFIQDDCYSKASALTFYSLLSLVPLLAVALGIAKGFGFEKYLEVELQRGIFEQREMAQQMISFSYLMLENAQGGLIACLGIITLFWTSLQLIGSIESNLNTIWEVKKGRSFVRRFSDYLALITLGPIFLVASGSLSLYVITKLNAMPKVALLETFNRYILILYHALPFFLVWALFSFIYAFIPNTKVRWRYALSAGLVASAAYMAVQEIYIHFQIGAANYGAVYGSLAALPLFLVWVHISWLILLGGAELTYHSEVIPLESDGEKYQIINQKQLALWIAIRCTKAFIEGAKPITADRMARELGTSLQIVRKITAELEAEGILVEVFDDGYLLGKSPESITLKSLEEALDENVHCCYPVKLDAQFEEYDRYLKTLDLCVGEASANLSLGKIIGARNEKNNAFC